jgi:hypothetical protein
MFDFYTHASKKSIEQFIAGAQFLAFGLFLVGSLAHPQVRSPESRYLCQALRPPGNSVQLHPPLSCYAFWRGT